MVAADPFWWKLKSVEPISFLMQKNLIAAHLGMEWVYIDTIWHQRGY